MRSCSILWRVKPLGKFMYSFLLMMLFIFLSLFEPNRLILSERISCEKAAAIPRGLSKRLVKKREEQEHEDEEEEEEDSEGEEEEDKEAISDDRIDIADPDAAMPPLIAALPAAIEENPHDDAHESRREFMYRTFRDAMCERFLRGEDFEYINYADIDNDDTPDLILCRTRDEEETYFDGADGVAVSSALAAGEAIAPMDVAVEEDYMNFDLSQL